MLMRLQKYVLFKSLRLSRTQNEYSRHAQSSISHKNHQAPAEKEYEIFKLNQEFLLYKDIEPINQAQYHCIHGSTQLWVKQAMVEDPTMQTLAAVVQKGWPDTCNDVPNNIRSYWGYRYELRLQDGLVYKGMQVVIPHKMQKETCYKRLLYVSRAGRYCGNMVIPQYFSEMITVS